MKVRMRLATPSRRSLIVAVGTCALFFILSVVLYLPTSPLDTTNIASGGFNDPAQLAWFLAWLPFAIEHPLNLFHSTYIEYPSGVNLAANTPVPLLGLLALPITLTLGPIASVNLLLHLAFTLSAESMYLVLRAWRMRWIAAVAGALLFGFSPYMITEANINAHVDLIFVPLLPLIVWLSVQVVLADVRSRARWGLLLGIVAGCQMYIDPELLLDLGMVLAFGLVGLAIAYRKELRSRARSVAEGLGTAGLVFMVLSVPYIWGAFFARGHLDGPVQAAGFLQWYRADLLGPVLPTTNQLLAPAKLAAAAGRFVHGNITENSAYLGLPLLVLLVVIVVAMRRTFIVRAAALLALVAFVLSLGSTVMVDNYSSGVPLVGSITMHVPVLDNILPARFALFVTLFAGIALSAGINRGIELGTAGPNGVVRLVALCATGVASIVFLLPRIPLTTGPVPWPASLPSTLDAIPEGSVVLSYPFPITPWSGPMLWQAEDRMRFQLIGGYATVRTPSGVGNTGPPLLAPDGVEEYLLSQQEGATSYFPQPPARYPNRERDLCTFLHRYHVGAVVYWGLPSSPVGEYFTAALGAASKAVDSVFVWLRTDQCQS